MCTDTHKPLTIFNIWKISRLCSVSCFLFRCVFLFVCFVLRWGFFVCNHGSTRTPSVGQAGLELRDPPVSASWDYRRALAPSGKKTQWILYICLKYRPAKFTFLKISNLQKEIESHAVPFVESQVFHASTHHLSPPAPSHCGRRIWNCKDFVAFTPMPLTHILRFQGTFPESTELRQFLRLCWDGHTSPRLSWLCALHPLSPLPGFSQGPHGVPVPF